MEKCDMAESFRYRTSIIVNINSTTAECAREWLIKRITDDKLENGCQLEVEVENNLIFISASRYRLLYGAEIIGLKKEYKDGSLREFCFSDGDNFKNFDDDDFLLESECHRIMKIELDGLRAVDETHVPGHPTVKLYPGKSIFRRMESKNLITDCFPLHNREALHKLRWAWYKNIKLTIVQPLDDVRKYFGDTISIYFAFLNFYTIFLFPLAMLGFLHWGFSAYDEMWWRVDNNWILSVIHVVWSAVLLEMWKRKSVEYSYGWGSLGLKEWEEPRAGFRGTLGMNEITNRQEPIYPQWKRYMRIYLISYPAIILCIVFAIFAMFYYFSWEFYLLGQYKHEKSMGASLLMNMPSIVYSIFILLANSVYRQLAQYLTDQENHRLESSYQNHLITKILLFDFTNNFLCLFYIAFVYDDMKMLRMTLRNLFLVHMIVSQALESLYPYWQYRIRSASFRSTLSTTKGLTTSSLIEKGELSKEEHAKLELQRDNYIGTFDDYLELWLQFGYVVLFSCVYPPAAIFALLNNLVEARSDAFKMCNVYRRPFAYQTNGIGVWQIAFQALSYLAIVSNLALIFHTQSFVESIYKIDPGISAFHVIILFVVLEHALLAVRWLISLAIPDVPHNVKVEMGKLQYWSLQALKQQRSLVLRPSDLIRRNIELTTIEKSK